MQTDRQVVLALLLAILAVTSILAMPVIASTGSTSVGNSDAGLSDVGQEGTGLVDAEHAEEGDAAPQLREHVGHSPAEDAFQQGDGDVKLAVTDDTIRLRNTIRQVDTVGEYGVTTRTTIPDRVRELRLTIPDNARNIQTTGFSQDGANTWTWDGMTSEPRLTYRMPANRTTDASGPLGGDGDYLFVDTGDWAIVRTPGIGVSWRSLGQARLQRENRVEGVGATSRAMAYLGPYEEHTYDAHGQRFRLIVPAAAEMADSPEEIFASMGHAAEALQVGDRDPEVFAIAAPTGDVQWGVRGIQIGPADMWVRDEEEIVTADNVWVHEYVHTRQGYTTDPSARWFTEGAATYYAALLTLERGDVTFSEFQGVLTRGERDPQASSILSQPDTWRNNADYTKGALVAGEIDRRIRLATDGEATLGTVFRELNAHDGAITSNDFLGYVADAGGSDARQTASRYTTTRNAPAAWDRSKHDEAFGQLPARIGYSLSADDAVRATGEYRDRPVIRNPVMLVTGETLELEVRVVNTGGVTGEYDLALVVEGDSIDARDGRLEADGVLVEAFDHRFTEPGEYEVAVGGTRVPVVVSEPARPTVADVRVSQGMVTAGETVTIEATVRNEDTIPARDELELRVDGEIVSTETVRLDAADELTYRVEVELSDPGETTLSLGGQSVTVTVEPTVTPTEDGVPGFGLTVAVLALVLSALIARRR